MDLKSLCLAAAFLVFPAIPSRATACGFGEATDEGQASAKFQEAITGMPLPQPDSTWDMLHDFYGDCLPDPIYLAYTQSGISRFGAPNIVVLAIQDFSDDVIREQTIAHETSHLGTFALTAGQSDEPPFRFIDEGFASIWQYHANVLGFKQYTMGVAKDYLHQGKVAFAQVQDWEHYFGSSPENFDYKAYNVGASFDFFLIDRYGNDGWKRFLTGLGETKDLGGALAAAFGLSKQDAEEAWKAYIAASGSD